VFIDNCLSKYITIVGLKPELWFLTLVLVVRFVLNSVFKPNLKRHFMFRFNFGFKPVFGFKPRFLNFDFTKDNKLTQCEHTVST